MWTGVGDGVGDTPQTVMTTRAPAVLKRLLNDFESNIPERIDIEESFE